MSAAAAVQDVSSKLATANTPEEDDAEKRYESLRDGKSGTDDTKSHRNWCFTDFNANQQELDRLKGLINEANDYLCVGYETCPKTGRPHFQGYIHWGGKSRTQTQVNNKLNRDNVLQGHVHIHHAFCKGNALANINYCSGNCKKKTPNPHFWQFGIRPKDDEENKQGKRSDLITIHAGIKDGTYKDIKQIMDNHPTQAIIYGRALRETIKMYKSADYGIPRKWPTEVIICWGTPGSGKSTWAIEVCGGEVIDFEKNGNGGIYVQGYSNEPIVVLEEFDPSTVPRGTMLKLTDKFKCVANVKGTETNWNPRKIIITTNNDPRRWYQGDLSWLRRITKLYYFDVIDGIYSQTERNVYANPDIDKGYDYRDSVHQDAARKRLSKQ